MHFIRTLIVQRQTEESILFALLGYVQTVKKNRIIEINPFGKYLRYKTKTMTAAKCCKMVAKLYLAFVAEISKRRLTIMGSRLVLVQSECL